MRPAILILCLLPLLACAPGMPDLENRISAEARAADYPQLVPLGPLLAGIAAEAPRSAGREGATLEARAEDLRRRAAWLRSLPL